MMICPKIISKKRPLFTEPIFVVRPNLPSAEELSPLIAEMLKKRQVTNFGDFHNELEERIRRLCNVKYAVLCCNGTVGLFLLLRALGLKGKVVTTAFTFPATVHSVFMAGLEPVFCDIDPDGYTLDVDSVERSITKDTSCILGVNVFGNVCDVERLQALGKKHNIPVIYDSAHAFLCKYKNKYVGGFGYAEMFSFHATKLFTTIEGGVVTTNNRRLYVKLKQLINFGIKDEESVTGIGLNGKMSEINAIFGLLSFEQKDNILMKLARLSECYKKHLSAVPGIKLQKVREGCKINNQYMTIEVIPEEFGLTRDELYEALKEDNIITRKYFYPPAHKYECYRGFEFADKARLANTDTLSQRILCLPIYATLKIEDVKKICDLIVSIRDNSKKIRSRLKSRSSCRKNCV